MIAGDILPKQGQKTGAEHRSEDIALNGYQAGEEQRDACAARSAVGAHESKVGLKRINYMSFKIRQPSASKSATYWPLMCPQEVESNLAGKL